ncbi:calvin cycle protein CP12-2, chloroplastic-like [Iris pallida]|uniref:Calvin cycle protein CP12-2, chloroplastic-like n=1 Tax=Iris pallida TaxID=29817 RepID=A0AAX6DRM9_IRIPA|nr:calvin cycle protein CP12-2, chloroplastic-like [Iris pallida]
MATALSSVSLPTPRGLVSVSLHKSEAPKGVLIPSGRGAGRRVRLVRAAAGSQTPPQGVSEQLPESIKKAEEACAGDPVSGECVAAWDEVEELSAAASHARDKAKTSDPLEEYCKDNPETDECRTYED